VVRERVRVHGVLGDVGAEAGPARRGRLIDEPAPAGPQVVLDAGLVEAKEGWVRVGEVERRAGRRQREGGVLRAGAAASAPAPDLR